MMRLYAAEMMNTVSRHDRGERDGEVGVLAKVLERLLGTVGRRGEPVGAEADPGQERDQRDLVEDARVVNVAGLAEDGPPHAREEGVTRVLDGRRHADFGHRGGGFTVGRRARVGRRGHARKL